MCTQIAVKYYSEFYLITFKLRTKVFHSRYFTHFCSADFYNFEFFKSYVHGLLVNKSVSKIFKNKSSQIYFLSLIEFVYIKQPRVLNQLVHSPIHINESLLAIFRKKKNFKKFKKEKVSFRSLMMSPASLIGLITMSRGLLDVVVGGATTVSRQGSMLVTG